MARKRLVVCFDGTWNTPDKGDNPTNVVKMVRAVRNIAADGVSQVTFYDKGVGTAGFCDKYLGGTFGIGLTENIIDGYRFLANNFDAGDEIYVFGFSRGAYTARSLAAVIGFAGMLSPMDLGGNLLEIMEIYHAKDKSAGDKKQELEQISGIVRQPAEITCIGVWDTVGSLGIPGDFGRRFQKRQYFDDVELGPAVKVALHAIGIDEKRSAFSPTLWVSPDGKPGTDGQVVEQVWFAGVHTNIGGSYADCGLSDITFDWMVRRLRDLTELDLDWDPTKIGPDLAGARGYESRTALYADSKLYPYQRVMNGEIPEGKGVGEWFRRTFPEYDRRNIPPDNLRTVNEALHVSALDRWSLPGVPHDCRDDRDEKRQPYRPVNLAAVIRAAGQGDRMRVIGWNGQPMLSSDVKWPKDA